MEIINYTEQGWRKEHIVRHDGHAFQRVQHGNLNPRWRFDRDMYYRVTTEEAARLERAYQEDKEAEGLEAVTI